MERLMEYFLLSSVEETCPQDYDAILWLINNGATIKPERAIAWSALENKFPDFFAKNLSEL